MAATSTLPSMLKSPASKTVYARLLARLRTLGRFQIEEKKTSVHLSNGRAFAGVHPRANGLVVQIVTEVPIRHARVRKIEQVSANRYHCAVPLENEREIDSEFLGWVNQAYALTNAKK